MTWQDRLLDTQFTITTGDGTTWTPKWLPQGKSIEYNNSIYDYPQLPGSFVDRREVKGGKYTFVIMFEGQDNIDEGEAFERSARDNRSWRITHPYYGNLTVQPVRLTIDNSGYNVYKIKVECIETLTTDQSATRITTDAEISTLKTSIDNTIEISYETDIVTPTVEDVSNLQDTVTLWDQIQSNILTAQEDLANFKRQVSIVVGQVNNAINDIESAIRGVTDLINYPFRVLQSVQSRFNALEEAFNTLVNNVTAGATLDSVSSHDKIHYMATAGAILSTASLISIVQPEPTEAQDPDVDLYDIRDDYPSRTTILSQIESINTMYTTYITTLDTLTTDRGDDTDSFIPSPELIFQLQQIVTTTVRNLEQQIFGVAQERVVTLEEDSDVINITHRFLGLDSEDENINTIINVNGLSLNDTLVVRKGRTIRYYI